MRTIFKNLVKDHFKAHKSIHFSQMHVSRKEDSESYEDGLLSEENITEAFAASREQHTIMQAIDKLE